MIRHSTNNAEPGSIGSVEAYSTKQSNTGQRKDSNLFVEQTSWKSLLIAAKATYDKGDKSKGLRLYREGLIQADKALLHKRDELIDFLQENIWGTGS